MPDIFISYASAHQVAVLKLRDDLEREGFTVWFAPDAIPTHSHDWQSAILQGIDDAQAFIYIGSKEAVKSPYVQAEVLHALDSKKAVYCFWLHGKRWEKCRPFDLAKHHWIDGRGPRYAQGLSDLLKALRQRSPDALQSSSESQPGVEATSELALQGATTPMPAPIIPDVPQNFDVANSSDRPPVDNAIELIEIALQKAEVLERDGRIPEAIDVCTPLLSNGADVAMVRYYLGYLCQRAGRYEDARAYFQSSRFESEYTVASLLALGQCAREVGNLTEAIEYFDEALAWLPFNQLNEQDAGLLIELCYDTASAYKDVGNAEQARKIADALRKYLHMRQWENSFEIANHLMGEVFTRRWKPQTELAPGSESRLFNNKMPQLAADGIERYPEPGPIGQGIEKLVEASQAGIWPTPPSIPVFNLHDVLPIYRIPRSNDNDGDTSPTIPIVLPNGVNPPTDILADVIAGMLDPGGSLPAYLHTIWPRSTMGKRRRVTQCARELGMKVQGGKLMTARLLCLELMELEPDYYDVEAALAEIYVRQGDVERAVSQYVRLAARSEKGGALDKAIASYERLLQLDENNQEFLQKFNDLCAGSGSAPIALAEPPNAKAEDAPEDARVAGDEGAQRATSSPAFTRDVPAPDNGATPEPSGRGLDETIPGRSLVENGVLPPWIADAARTHQQEAEGIAQQLERLAKLAQSFLQKNEIGDAILVLREMMRLAPNDPSMYERLAFTCITHYRFDEGVRTLNSLVTVYKRRGESSSMAQVYQRMVEIAPRQLERLANLAQYLLQDGQIDGAIPVLREMTRVAPNDPSTHEQLAITYSVHGRFDEAAKSLRALAKVCERRGESPRAAQAYHRIAEIVWKAQRRVEALELQRQAVCCAPGEMPLRAALVRYCQEMGRKAEAVEQQAYIARQYHARHDLKLAEQAYQYVFHLDKMALETYDLLGQLYCEQARYEESAQVYRDLSVVAPDSLLAQIRLKEIAMRLAEIEARKSAIKAEDDAKAALDKATREAAEKAAREAAERAAHDANGNNTDDNNKRIS